MIGYQGQKFKNFLKERNISVKKIAELLKLNRQSIYIYFKSKNLQPDTVNKIIDTLKVSESEIWGDNTSDRKKDLEPEAPKEQSISELSAKVEYLERLLVEKDKLIASKDETIALLKKMLDK